MLRLKKLKIDSNAILLPMAGFSDLSFRLIARKHGCKFAFAEMTDATAIRHNNRQTLDMLATNKKDQPLGAQLVGAEEYDLLFAAQMLEQKKISWIDINAACPAKKVIKKHAGSYLMKDTKKLAKILKLLSKNLKIPLSLKIRSGFTKNNINAVEVSKLAQDCGVDAVIIHGRNRDQGYKGSVDYKIIARVVKHLQIPVIASGDIFSAELAKKMMNETGCEAVGVARGCMGNPWIFKEIDKYLEKGAQTEIPEQETIIKTLFEHLSGSIDMYGEQRSLPKMRKVISSYVRNFRGARKLRGLINQTGTLKELKEIFKKYSLKNHQKQKA